MKQSDLEIADLIALFWLFLFLAVLHSLGITSWETPIHAELIQHNVVNNYLIPARRAIENRGGGDNDQE